MTTEDMRYLPLVSPRSPSYIRASNESNAGTSTASASVAGLNRLVEAENDARQVCERIASDTEDRTLRELTAHLAIMHLERASMVGNLVKRLGGSAPTLEESRATLQFGLCYFEGLSGVSEVRSALHRMYPEIRGEYLRQVTELEIGAGLRHALQDMCPSLDGILECE